MAVVYNNNPGDNKLKINMINLLTVKKPLSRLSLERLLQNTYAFGDGWDLYQLDPSSEDNDKDYFVLCRGYNEGVRYGYYGAEYCGSTLYLYPEHSDKPVAFTILVIGNIAKEI